MGNIVFSRRPSLREELLSLEEKIHKVELYLEVAHARKSSISFWINVVLLLTPPAAAVLVSLAGKKPIAYGSLLFVATFLLKKLTSIFYLSRIRNREKLLAAYRETQKLRVEELKREVMYTETKKIIEKYEIASDKTSSRTKSSRQKKGIVEKITDVVLGSDPSTMYALICARCFSHNGLVSPMEYRDVKFRCYSCDHFNDKTVAGSSHEDVQEDS
eukprot:jgi/Antlo1/926/2442